MLTNHQIRRIETNASTKTEILVWRTAYDNPPSKTFEAQNPEDFFQNLRKQTAQPIDANPSQSHTIPHFVTNRRRCPAHRNTLSIKIQKSWLRPLTSDAARQPQ